MNKRKKEKKEKKKEKERKKKKEPQQRSFLIISVKRKGHWVSWLLFRSWPMHSGACSGQSF
jgi:hypothetical protein